MRPTVVAGAATALCGAMLLGGLGLMLLATDIEARLSAEAGAPASLLFGLGGISLLSLGLNLLYPPSRAGRRPAETGRRGRRTE